MHIFLLICNSVLNCVNHWMAIISSHHQYALNFADVLTLWIHGFSIVIYFVDRCRVKRLITLYRLSDDSLWYYVCMHRVHPTQRWGKCIILTFNKWNFAWNNNLYCTIMCDVDDMLDCIHKIYRKAIASKWVHLKWLANSVLNAYSIMSTKCKHSTHTHCTANHQRVRWNNAHGHVTCQTHMQD